MATVLGKRKARTATADAPAISPEEAQEMLRRHFEAQFQPLDVGGPSDAAAADRKDVDGFDDDRSEESNAEEDDDDDDDDDDGETEGSDDDDDNDEWGGLSDSDVKTPAPPQIEVVEHVSVPNPASARAADPALRRETKAYLSSKVPTASALAAATAAPAPGKGKKSGAEGEDETSAALLRNDLALQRLLTESHLFTAGPLGGGATTTTPEHAGRNRHLATDLRLAALGSKGSIYKQAKMPMAHRKGIIAAAETRDAKRRREARENGIVLEKPTAGVHEGWTGLKSSRKQQKRAGAGAGGSRMRDAAVDAPAVGKLRNGMLQLSKKDVQSIQGGGDGRRGAAAGGGKRRRR